MCHENLASRLNMPKFPVDRPSEVNTAVTGLIALIESALSTHQSKARKGRTTAPTPHNTALLEDFTPPAFHAVSKQQAPYDAAGKSQTMNTRLLINTAKVPQTVQPCITPNFPRTHHLDKRGQKPNREHEGHRLDQERPRIKNIDRTERHQRDHNTNFAST